MPHNVLGRAPSIGMFIPHKVQGSVDMCFCGARQTTNVLHVIKVDFSMSRGDRLAALAVSLGIYITRSSL